jgi:hypothetical protein
MSLADLTEAVGMETEGQAARWGAWEDDVNESVAVLVAVVGAKKGGEPKGEPVTPPSSNCRSLACRQVARRGGAAMVGIVTKKETPQLRFESRVGWQPRAESTCHCCTQQRQVARRGGAVMVGIVTKKETPQLHCESRVHWQPRAESASAVLGLVLWG